MIIFFLKNLLCFKKIIQKIEKTSFLKENFKDSFERINDDHKKTATVGAPLKKSNFPLAFDFKLIPFLIKMNNKRNLFSKINGFALESNSLEIIRYLGESIFPPHSSKRKHIINFHIWRVKYHIPFSTVFWMLCPATPYHSITIK